MGIKFTEENASEKGRAGGRKSGETRRRKREIMETINSMMAMPLRTTRIDDIDKLRGFEAIAGKNITVGEYIVAVQIQKAMDGDLQAFLALRDSAGQKPLEKMEVTSIPVPVFGGEDELPD